eukprot:scaffold3753_cov98-Skeletonema_dohrnii-CCMP3373.AAC.9
MERLRSGTAIAEPLDTLERVGAAGAGRFARVHLLFCSRCLLQPGAAPCGMMSEQAKRNCLLDQQQASGLSSALRT